MHYFFHTQKKIAVTNTTMLFLKPMAKRDKERKKKKATSLTSAASYFMSRFL